MNIQNMEWENSFFSNQSNQILAKIDQDFLLKEMDNPEISEKISNFEEGKNCILNIGENQDQKAAFYIYGLIHAKYIESPAGISQMIMKSQNHLFKTCPRIDCQRNICFSIGVSDDLNISSVKMYCPKCQEIYNVIDDNFKNIDGAFFGTHWISKLIEMNPQLKSRDVESSNNNYIPRIFGFKIYHHPNDHNEEENKKEQEKSDQKPNCISFK